MNRLSQSLATSTLGLLLSIPAVAEPTLTLQFAAADTQVVAQTSSEEGVAATLTFTRDGEIVLIDEAHIEPGGVLLGLRSAALAGQPDGEYRVVIDAQAEVAGESVVARQAVSFRLSDGEIYFESLGGELPQPSWGRSKEDLTRQPIDASEELLAESSSLVIGTNAEPQDPSTFITYPCYYIRNYTWNFPDGIPAVQGQIRFPSATCDSSDGPPSGRPLLIFAHGNGMGHKDHRYLMAHLARNGFVTASIANGGDNDDRGAQMISYLDGLKAYWGFKGRLSNVVAFAGHSRGGEAAVTAARLVSEGIGANPYDVRAVISIAPTDGGGTNGPNPRETLTGAMTDGYLAIYGSHDVDVNGSSSIAANLVPQKTAFAIYDRAGAEFSSEGVQFWGTHLEKAFVFLVGAGHGVFKDSSNVFGGGTVEGQNTARAYFNAFLRWKTWGQDHYRGFFDGTWQPDSIETSDIRQQFSGGLRRVIDDFENGDDGSSRIGDTVTNSNLITFLEGNLHQTISSSPHETGGLRLTWANNEWVRWGIPNAAPFGIGSLRNVSFYTHLSLRAAQVYGNAFNTEGADQDIHLRVFSGAGFSTKVRLSDHGRLPYPDEFTCNIPQHSCIGDYSKSAMNTTRIPLSAFNNVDWTDVRSVYIYTDVPGHDSGAIAIDSLEFTRNN